jgi:hypothetical protein
VKPDAGAAYLSSAQNSVKHISFSDGYVFRPSGSAESTEKILNVLKLQGFMSLASSSSENTAPPLAASAAGCERSAADSNSYLRQKIDSAVYSIRSIISGRWFAGDRGDIAPLVDEPTRTRDLFAVAADRIHGSQAYREEATAPAPHGYYLGRPIVGERTRINGGIYIGARAQEALVVDDRYGLLKRLFSKLCGRSIVIREHKKNYEYEIFGEVLHATRRAIAYSKEGVERIARIEKLQVDQKVSLDVYIEHNVGVSRHRVLLAAYLVEKLRDMGVIEGHATIERHEQYGEERELLVYTTPSGQVYEFDPVEKTRLIRAEKF